MKTTNDLMNVLNNIDDKEGLNEYLNGLEKYKDLDAIKYYDTLRKVREENKIKWNDDTLKKAYNKYVDDLIENAKPKQEEEQPQEQEQ